MHKGSLDIMQHFINKYIDNSTYITVLDIGSRDINGNFKSLFQNKNCKYLGLDILSGPNVDIVSKGPYDFGLVNQFDFVISGNCLEHVEAPWKWIKEVERVTKPGGIVCIITPFATGIHGYPVDCYRILPDGYRYLLEKEGNFTVPETEAIMKIHIFHRPKFKWIVKILPKYIKEKLTFIPDTYVIARKNIT